MENANKVIVTRQRLLNAWVILVKLLLKKQLLGTKVRYTLERNATSIRPTLQKTSKEIKKIIGLDKGPLSEEKRIKIMNIYNQEVEISIRFIRKEDIKEDILTEEEFKIIDFLIWETRPRIIRTINKIM